MHASFRRAPALLPLLIILSLALAGGMVAAAPSAQGAIALTARPAFENVFRPGSWLPVIVELENAGVDRTVEVRVGTREGAQYAAEVELPHGGRKSLTLYAYLTPASRRLTVRLLGDGQELATEPIALPPANPRAHYVGVLAGEGAAVRLPARLDDGTPLVAVSLRPSELPGQSLGLSMFNAVLLEDVATAELSAPQMAALREWVLRGGQLILGGGTGLARTLAGLPAELVPADAREVTTLPAASLLGAETAGAADIPFATLAPRQLPGAPAPYLVPLAALGGASAPAFEQSFGRGSVTMLAFPMAHPALVGWEQAPTLWGQVLKRSTELPAGFAPEQLSMDGFIEGNLAASLTSLPALEFPPLGLLMGLVLAYIVLVGPVTYLVLRRLDRQALGWVVVPGITALFAGLTYGLGYAQRGGDVVFNQVTLVEPLDGTDQARVRSFVGVFSPERRSYTLEVSAIDSGDPLVRPISVQGPWDVAGSGAGGVFLQESPAGAQASDFEVPQWSLRAITADTLAPFPAISAAVRLDGERLTAEVTNPGPLTLREVAVVQADRVARLGDIAPGETKGGELRRRQPGQPGGFAGSVPVSYLIFGEEMDAQSRNGGQPLPLELQQRIRLLDALFNYGPSTRGGHPLVLAWADSAGVQVRPAGVRAEEQHTTMITLTPRVELADDDFTLGQGWFAPRFTSGQTSVCFGGMGTGVTLGQEPSVMDLVLPRDLYGVRPSELTLLASSDGPWSNEIVVELYDWVSGVWEAQPAADRAQAVSEPARFLGPHGALRVRLIGPPHGSFGCIYLDASLKGARS